MSNYVQVYAANGQLDAEMIRLFLQSNGIPAEVLGESVGTIYGLTITPLGEVKIMVPHELADEARRLLSDMESGKIAEDAFLEEDQTDSDVDDQQS